MDAGLRRRTSRFTIQLLLLILLTGSRAFAHPFDGDGSGPAAAGSSNLRLYLYLEPPTCRVECLVWMPTAQALCGLPPGTDMLMSAAQQRAVVAAARDLIPAWCVLRVDGGELRALRTHVSALRGMPGRSEQPVPGEPIAVMDSMLGLTWEFQMPAQVGQVELEWRGFLGEVTAVPVTVLYGPMVEVGMTLTKDKPASAWKNGGRLPEAPPLAPVPPADGYAPRLLPAAWVFTGIIGVLALLTVYFGKPPRLRRGLMAAATAGVAIMLAWWLVPASWAIRINRPLPPPAHDEAERIVNALLRNTYRAFDQGSESAIYDVLARGAHGDLLEKLYLQTIRSLSLEGMEGTRVKVTELAATVDRVIPHGDGFIAEGTWTALGTVGHWGHMHQRVNRYKARLTLAPIGTAWKLTGLDVLEEVRS